MTFAFTDDSICLRKYFLSKCKVPSMRSLKDIYTHFKNISLRDVSIQSHDIIESKIKDIGNKFISKNLKSKIIHSLLQKTICKITVGEINVILNIYSIENEKLDHLIYNIIKCVRFMCSLSDPPIHNLVINYYLLEDKKELDNKKGSNGNCILTKEKVNSGSCSQTIDQSVIDIWRKEEILKVTIHELIHALHFENYQDTFDLIKHYQDKYNISSKKINSKEAYTEIWANIINCYLISVSQNKTNQKQYQSFQKMIALEKEYSIYLSEKILYLCYKNNTKGIHKIDINKYTNVLSYYIIRAELYNHLNKFLHYCKNNNTDYIKIKNDTTWISFLKKNKKIKMNNRRFNNIKKMNIIYKTLRMSLNELLLF